MMPLVFSLYCPSTPALYTLSLHDALPISGGVFLFHRHVERLRNISGFFTCTDNRDVSQSLNMTARSEEHTSELQSLRHLVCRLLLEKKKKQGRERKARCASSQILRSNPMA